MANCSRCGAPYTCVPERKCTMCGNCKREYMRQWRADRKASGNPVISAKAPPEYHAAYGATYRQRPDVRQKRAQAARRRYRAPEHRERILARLATRSALRRGILLKMPCEVCGDAKVDAHHDDYAQPLNVKWLCRRHHVELHSKASAP